MDTLINFALTTIASTGVSAVLLVALGWLFRNWIGERLKGSIKHEYDDRLENLKAELRVQNDLQIATLKSEFDRKMEKMRVAALSFSDVQRGTIARKLEAIDTLWLGVLAAKSKFPPPVMVMDLWTEDEMKNAYQSKLAPKLTALHFASGTELFGDIENCRPHVGEVIWAHFTSYRALLALIIFQVVLARDIPDKIFWYRDPSVRRIIKTSLGDEKLLEFETLQSRSRVEWLLYHFEAELIKAIDWMLTGRQFSEAALHHAQEMERKVMDAQWGVPLARL